MWMKIYNKSIIPNLPPEREADITLSLVTSAAATYSASVDDKVTNFIS